MFSANINQITHNLIAKTKLGSKLARCALVALVGRLKLPNQFVGMLRIWVEISKFTLKKTGMLCVLRINSGVPSSLAPHVVHVVFVCSEKKMTRIDALSIVAFMEYAKDARIAPEKSVRNAIRSRTFPVRLFKYGIPSLGFTLPSPTLIGRPNIHQPKKPFRFRFAYSWHSGLHRI